MPRTLSTCVAPRTVPETLDKLVTLLLARPDWLVLALVGTLSAFYFGRVVRQRRKRHTPSLPSAPLSRQPIEANASIERIPAFQLRFAHLVDAGTVVDLVDDVIAMGFSLNASDIHMTPTASGARVAVRVDGVLYELGLVSPERYATVVSRIKVLAELTLYKRSTPQDGEIEIDGGRRIRVSLIPTSRGEKVVMRLASSAMGHYEIDKLGMRGEMLAQLRAILRLNQGMLIVTGPTGSGKTTTMYASMMHIQETRGESVNTVTLEDPVEFDFPEFSQTQISPETGLTFAVGLRSILRQDPDVILVGEVRDEETAEIALRAAMTGHFIFSTLHADSAAGVFARLNQIGAERFHVASAVKVVISQRLCRRLCPHCRVEAELDETNLQQFKLLGYDTPPDGPFYVSEGCPQCLHKGHLGRTPIFEMLLVTDRVRDLINEGKPTHVIAEAAQRENMMRLLDDGLARARAGEISADELLRVVDR